MTVYRLWGDDEGETHLTKMELTPFDGSAEGAGRVRVLGGIPAQGFAIAETVDPLPDLGIHEAPKRRFLVILSGEYEITGTSGDQVRLRAGDCLLTDDIGSKGHYSHDVGEERLAFAGVDIPDDWECPTS